MHRTMIKSIDHFVITVADLEATLAFYESVLDLRRSLSISLGTASPSSSAPSRGPARGAR
jgi:predicted enzyme related to lactoylglutathione lyase